MNLHQIIEDIASAHNKSLAQQKLESYKSSFPFFDFLLSVNDGDIVLDGLNMNDPSLTSIPVNNTDSGRSGIDWYWRAKSPFAILNMKEGQNGYSPAIKSRILQNMLRALPDKEAYALITCLRGELRQPKSDAGMDSQQYYGALAFLNVEEETVQVENSGFDKFLSDNEVVVDGLVEMVTVYVNPDDDSKVWKGKGRKPKWLTTLIENGHDLESFSKQVPA